MVSRGGFSAEWGVGGHLWKNCRRKFFFGTWVLRSGLGSLPWTLTWAGLVLLGQVTGEWSASSPQDKSRLPPEQRPAQLFVQVAVLAPVALAWATHPLLKLGVYSASWCGSFWFGRQEALNRRGRPAATAEQLWLPSRRERWQAGVSVRITSWPRRTRHGWSAAGVILAHGQIRKETGSRPTPVGDGVLLRGTGEPPQLWQII